MEILEFSVYFFIVGIIEIIAVIFWKKRRKRIEQNGQYIDAQVLTTIFIPGKPDRYRYKVKFFDETDVCREHAITIRDIF